MLYKQPDASYRDCFWETYWHDGFEKACKNIGFLSAKSLIKNMLGRLWSWMRRARVKGIAKFSNTGQAKLFKPSNKKKPIDQRIKTDQRQLYPQVFAGKHKSDEIRSQSSSGGAFYALASYVIEQGGAVYGCAFDAENRAIHIRCTTKKELKLCMGSKYSQSDLGDSIQKVKEDLENGLVVLFTGTPCQVAAVRAVCENRFESNSVVASKGFNVKKNFKEKTNESEIPVLFRSEEECCGCSACAAVCPTRAITIQSDVKGFFYPVVDETRCIGCMRCKRVCHFKEESACK